jgi:hypothetical protein
MPGVSRERLNIQTDKNTLTIDGDVQIATAEGMEALYAEVNSTHYRRSFTLSGELGCDDSIAKSRSQHAEKGRETASDAGCRLALRKRPRLPLPASLLDFPVFSAQPPSYAPGLNDPMSLLVAIEERTRLGRRISIAVMYTSGSAWRGDTIRRPDGLPPQRSCASLR